MLYLLIHNFNRFLGSYYMPSALPFNLVCGTKNSNNLIHKYYTKILQESEIYF